MGDQVGEPAAAPGGPRDVARWLTTPDGARFVDHAMERLARSDEAAHLHAITWLRRRGLTIPMASMVVDVAMARRSAVTTAPHATDWLMTPTALQQGSDPAVSRWRARRYAAASQIWDLCAGVGFDAFNLADHGEVHAVESDPVRAVFAAWNLRSTRHPVTVHEADALSVEPPPTALVHADPARRDGSARLRTLATYRPGVDRLMRAHGRSPGVGVVVSPSVDWNDRVLMDLADSQPGGVEVEFMQKGPRLVEGTIWTGDLREPGARASATVLDADQAHHRVRAAEPRMADVRPVAALLIVPAPALVRARLHDEVGEEIDAGRISARRALLTTDRRPVPSPWYRIEDVEWTGAADVRRVKAWLRTVEDRPCELVVHGLDVDVASWWRRLPGVTRGPQGRRIHLVRTARGAMAIATIVTDAGA